MPSQSFPDQTVIMMISQSGEWLAIGASGQFLLRYLRGRHNIERRFLVLNDILARQRFDVDVAGPHPVDTAAQGRRLLNAHFFYKWSGVVYVEYLLEEDLTTNPSRVEWSGAVTVATAEELAKYFLPRFQTADLGPIKTMLPGVVE